MSIGTPGMDTDFMLAAPDQGSHRSSEVSRTRISTYLSCCPPSACLLRWRALAGGALANGA